MRTVLYTDLFGRKTRVLIPGSAPDSEAALGIVQGPPPLESLGLPLEVEVRLHNQLYDRELFTLADLRRRPNDLLGAVLSAMKVDAQRVKQVYQDFSPEKSRRDGQS